MGFGIGNQTNRGKVLKVGAAVGLAGLCATGVAAGVACPLLMGAAGFLALSALRGPGSASCVSCVTEPEKEARS